MINTEDRPAASDETHPACLPPEMLDAQCQMTTTRRSGPGGQHRNKVSSAVILTHPSSGVWAEAAERRSQHANRRVALYRLRVNLALALRGGAAVDHGPSERWRSRLQGRRMPVSRDNDQFPALLAEALDALQALNHDVAAAAQKLQTTTSQLVKLLSLEPRALKLVNDARQAAGLLPLKPR